MDNLHIDRLVTSDPDATLTIQQKFEVFHRLNPWVYGALEVLAADYMTHRRRIGIGMLFEVLRWQYGRTVGDDFKLNNNFRSRYVRLLIAHHPEWADAFETRTLRAA